MISETTDFIVGGTSISTYSSIPLGPAPFDWRARGLELHGIAQVIVRAPANLKATNGWSLVG